MDVKSMDQGLLTRNPSMTPEEYSNHWYTKHAPLVIPFFLHSGIQHYEQVHGPLSLTDPTSPHDFDLSNYDGAAAMPPQKMLDNPAPMPAWKQAYYDEVIKVDERRFLVSEALDHIFRVDPNTVKGDRRIVIQNGKPLVDVSEEVWEVWRTYEKMGESETDKVERI